MVTSRAVVLVQRTVRDQDATHNETSTMTKVHPSQREALLAHLQRGIQRSDGEYLTFLDEARDLLLDKKDEVRFEFVIRRLWFAFDCEEPDGWQAVIRDRYDRFVAEFEWTKTEQAIALDPALVERTLALWQRHWPLPMKAKHAAEIIVNVRRLADVTGGVR